MSATPCPDARAAPRSYGHYTTLFDGLFGTLERPKLEAAEAEAAPAGQEDEPVKPAGRATRSRAVKAQ